ncbi:protein of unknown function DUF5016 [Fusobacterium phage JD-Fnp4]|nr:protein of unknown function DUF5016 [Fusobacterium phage JD-Fnp4]
MKKVMKVLMVMMLGMMLVGCDAYCAGRKNQDVGYVNNVDYSYLSSPEYLDYVKYFINDTEAWDVREYDEFDLTVVNKVLQITYKGYSIGDTIARVDKYADSIGARRHYVNMIYFNDYSGQVMITWERMALFIPFTIQGDDNILILGQSKDFLQHIASIKNGIERNYGPQEAIQWYNSQIKRVDHVVTLVQYQSQNFVDFAKKARELTGN